MNKIKKAINFARNVCIKIYFPGFMFCIYKILLMKFTLRVCDYVVCNNTCNGKLYYIL